MEKSSNKKVGIFTTLSNWDKSYSIVSVIHDQLVGHVRFGYEPVLFVLESFDEKDISLLPKGVEVRKAVKQVMLEPYKGMAYPDKWRQDVDEIKEMLHGEVEDIDVMITHDIIFIDCYLPYNIALREMELPCRYLHWIHSAPSPRPVLEKNIHANRYTLPPNSRLVYLNHDKMIALAEMYGTYLTNVRVIHNAIDPRTYWDIDPFVEKMIGKYGLLESDITSVYPLSTPRMIAGKQINVVIKIHAELKKLGYKTKLIVPNSHCNRDVERGQVQSMIDLAKQHGLTETEVIFTSREGHENGVSRRIVSDFFRLSNVFIFPSISENCSLILLEAMMSGNLLVLNKDCTGLQEFGGANALYFKFGNLDMGIRNEEKALNSPHYYTDIAKIIGAELAVHPALKAKMETFKTKNIDYIFRKIEQLYYER